VQRARRLRARGPAAAGAALASLALVACGMATPVASHVTLSPAPGSGAVGRSVAGEASLRQFGERISGSLRVSGLAPRSRHGLSIQGPFGGCAPIDQPANMALRLQDLVANGNGIATVRFDHVVHERLITAGYDIAVYGGPGVPVNLSSGSDPMLLCGDIRPPRRGSGTRPAPGGHLRESSS
jgi:hypothetical protein